MKTIAKSYQSQINPTGRIVHHDEAEKKQNLFSSGHMAILTTPLSRVVLSQPKLTRTKLSQDVLNLFCQRLAKFFVSLLREVKIIVHIQMRYFSRFWDPIRPVHWQESSAIHGTCAKEWRGGDNEEERKRSGRKGVVRRKEVTWKMRGQNREEDEE